MTNELLLSNLHLIRLAVDSFIQRQEDSDWNDRHLLDDMRAFQHELEIEAALGDSP